MAYQYAKAKHPKRGMKGVGAVLIPYRKGKFHIYIMHGDGPPFGRSTAATEEKAKEECLESMGIQPHEWISREGEPSWLQILVDADNRRREQRRIMKSGEDPTS